jgi:hypothetical protein
LFALLLSVSVIVNVRRLEKEIAAATTISVATAANTTAITAAAPTAIIAIATITTTIILYPY